MNSVFLIICLALSAVFLWSTVLVLIGLLKTSKKHPECPPRLRFAILICARNEESVIRLPVKSVMMSKYPAKLRDVIVLADNCTDGTAKRAREAGAIVWEKSTPSTGKGDVLAWGIQRLRREGDYDAVAVFDADNIMSDTWLNRMNEALSDGESVVIGRRCASNAGKNMVSGWYTLYWGMMNELSNRVRTNLGLSGKLTGTGFAFLLASLGADGWKTCTMVEDVEFSVLSNFNGNRIAYVAEADYADEQPEGFYAMWRQLRRWATGGWQVIFHYFVPWLGRLCKQPSLRLFDSFFAIVTGVSVAFIHLFNILALVAELLINGPTPRAFWFFAIILGFSFVASWIAAIATYLLSSRKRAPRYISVLTFPLFSLVLSATVIYTLLRPSNTWKPIAHTGSSCD